VPPAALVALLLLPTAATDLTSALDFAAVKQLHEAREWHLLLHHRQHLRGARSELDDPTFFVHPRGRSDPGAELRASLRGLFAPARGDPERHLQCRFPARAAWLRQQLGLTAARLPAPACRGWPSWLAKLRPGRVTLVFASAFINAPPSMFGHTMLRIDRADAPGDPLLSTIINYAGRPNTKNPLLYAWRGLTGGFPGRFGTLPYYRKVAEYSDLDHRDLWEYELTLSAAQIRRLLLHVWELRDVRFKYRFVGGNCAYQVLPLLDVADPSLRLAESFPLTTVPGDTVRAITNKPGLVRRRVFRPALTRTLHARRRRLSGDEAALAARIAAATRASDIDVYLPPLRAKERARGPARAGAAATNLLMRAKERARGPARAGAAATNLLMREALVLDAAHDLRRFRSPARRDDRVARAILRRRAAAKVRTPRPEVEQPAGPEEGHGSSRVGAGLGLDGEGEPFTELSWRLAYHDLLDRSAGFAPDAEIAAFDLRLRLAPRLVEQGRWSEGLTLERLDLLRVTSITPGRSWLHAPSWHFALGLGRAADLSLRGRRNLSVDLSGGVGYALSTRLLGREVYYVLADLRLSAGPAYDPGYRVGAGARAGLLLEPLPAWRLHAEAVYRYDLGGDPATSPHLLGVELGTNVALSRSVALRLRGAQLRAQRELLASLLVHFD
jgi:Domain of unknown function (DUF4105)